MTGTEADEAVARAFEEQRGRLIAVAYRMLGSRVDAEDAVQEAWLRLARQDATGIDNLAGWLTTVVGRVCIDVLRTRKTRGETSYDERLPELVVTEDVEEGPEDTAVMAESVGLAMLVVLNALGPAERLAFVLHDMFAVPFAEIGQILGTSSDAAKMHASRARRKVQGTPRTTAGRDDQRAVVDAFLAAARDGDFEGLVRVLDPDVTWRVHTGRRVMVRQGVDDVVDKAQRALHVDVTARRVLVNDEPGVAVWSTNGRLRAVMACTVVNGLMVWMESVTDPSRLAAIDLPAVPPEWATSLLPRPGRRRHVCETQDLRRRHTMSTRLDHSASPAQTQVAVIGGGYAGVMAANRLTQRDDVAVTLINPRASFIHRIRLHQFVGGSDDAVVHYSELLSDRIRLVVDSVTQINASELSVTLAGGDTIGYDYLIYAIGSGSATPEVPGAAEHAFPMASVEEAQRARDALADLPDTAPVTVVGGGPSGIEIAAELAEAGRSVTLVCGEVLNPYLHPQGPAQDRQASGQARRDRDRRRRREGHGSEPRRCPAR